MIRLAILDKWLKIQEKDLAQIEAIVSDITKTSAAVQKKLEKVTNYHQLLTTRVENVLRIVSSHQGGLSPAEKQWHKELKERLQRLPSYHSKITQLSLQVEKLVAAVQQQEPTTLSNKHLENLQPILEEEFMLISKTTEKMKALQLALDEEEPKAVA